MRITLSVKKSALGITLLSAALWASLAPSPVNGQAGDTFEPGRAERFVEIWIDDPADDFLLTKVYEAYARFDRVDELMEQLKRRADALGPLLDPEALTRRERRRRVNIQLTLARVLQKRDRTDAMMPHVQRALALDADHPLALTLHAELLARSGRTETAAAAIERALQRERRPDQRVALLETLGELRLRANDRPGAVAAFERILGESPDDYFQAVALAELYTRHDLLEEAVGVHRRIISGPGKRDRSLALKSRLATGQLLDRLQQPQQALTELELIVAQTRRGHWLRDQAVNAIFKLHVSRGWFSELRQYLEARINAGGMGAVPDRAAEGDSTSAEQRELVVLLVRALTLDGRYQEANQRLQAAIATSPGDPDLRRALVKLRHESPTFGAAAQREALRGLLDMLPGDRRARIDLALSLYAADEPSKAREAWEPFAAGASPAPQALLELARRLAAGPGSAHALDLFKAAADAADPGEWSYFRELGRALQAAGHHAEALDAWQRMAPDGSNDLRGLTELGRVLRDTEHHAESITAWRRALALRPDDATLHHEIGLALNAVGEFGSAVIALKRAIELSRDDEARQRSRRELIALYHARGDLPQLIAEFDKRLLDDPEDIEVLSALADMHRENRDTNQAIRLLQRAQALAPRHVGVGRTLALLLATSSEDSKAALRQYHHMARIDRAQRHHHLMRAGGVQERAGDPEAALETWRAVLAESPPDADLLVELALRFERLGDKDESRDAERALAQAVAVDPLRSEAWRALGRVRTTLGDDLAAFNAFLEATRTGRSEDEVRLARELLYQCAESLGAARRAEGRYPEAVAVYRRAFVQAADSSTAGSLAARLFLCHEATSSWREAADVLHRLVLDYPNASIRVDADHQANAAWFARLKLATLPKEGRRHFSERHDAPARDLLARAERSGDPSLLEGVLIYRLSSVARRAAVSLARIHRDDGRLDECERLLEHALLSLPRGDDPETAISDAQLLAELCALSLVREQLDRTAFYLQLLGRAPPDAPVSVRLPDAPAAPALSVQAVSLRIREFLKARHHNVDELLMAFRNEAGRARRLPDAFEPPLTELWQRQMAGLDPRLEVQASRGEALARLSDGSLARLASDSGSPLGVIELLDAPPTPASEIVVWPAADLLVRGGETLTAHALADGARRFSFEAGSQKPAIPGGSSAQAPSHTVARRRSLLNLDSTIQKILAQITARTSASGTQSSAVTRLRTQLRQLLLLRAQVGRMATTSGFRSLLPVGLRLVFTGDHGQVWAIDPRGRLLWQTSTEDRLPSSTDKPTRVLYCEPASTLILVRGATVTALAPQDGSIRWRFEPSDPVTPTPRGRSGLAAIFGPQDVIDVALKGSLLYLVRANGTITCLNVGTAEQLAETRLEQEPGSLILGAGFLVSASVLSQTLTALDAKTLEPRWERPLSGEDLATWPATELAVSGSTLYLTGMWLRAFDLRTGRQQWEDTERRQMVLARTRESAGLNDGGDGKPAPTFLLGRPAFVAGRLIVACGDGTVLAYNRFEIELRNSLALVGADADDAAAQLRLARLYHQAGKRESEVSALQACMAAAARRQAPWDARIAKSAAGQLVTARISAAVELLPHEPEQARTELRLAAEGGAAAKARLALISLLTALAWEHQGAPEEAVRELAGLLIAQPAGGAELVKLSAARTLSVTTLARERLAALLQRLQDSDLPAYNLLVSWVQEQVDSAAGEPDRQRLAALGMTWATTAPGHQALLTAARLASDAGDRWQEVALLGALAWSRNVPPQLQGEALLALAEREPPMQARARLVALAANGPPRLAERARAALQRADSELEQSRLESGDLALLFRHKVISNSRTAIAFPAPVLRDGILYTASEDTSGPTLVALDTRLGGQPLFSASEPALEGFLDRPPLPPALALAGVSVVTAAHSVAARDANTGALRWSYTGRGLGLRSLVDASGFSGLADDPGEKVAEPPQARKVTGFASGSATTSTAKVIRSRSGTLGAVVHLSTAMATRPSSRGFTLAVDPDAPQRVVVLETSGKVTALASDDGHVLWSRAASPETMRISSRGPRGPNQPVVRGGYGPGSPALRAWGGRIVICDGRSALVFDAASGRRLLRIALSSLNSEAPAADRKSFGGALASSVTVGSEALHVTDIGGKVGVWSLHTGNLLWSSFSLDDQGGEGLAALAPGPGQSYVAVLWGKALTATDQALHLMRSHRWQDGRRRWDGRKAWYYDHQAVASGTGSGTAGELDAERAKTTTAGRVVVARANLPRKPSGPIVFAAPPQGRGPLHASMAIHGDQIFVAQETLLVFDLESGQLQAQLPLGGGQAESLKAGAPPYPQGFLPPPPLVSGGYIYVVRPDGQLHAYSGSPKAAPSPSQPGGGD